MSGLLIEASKDQGLVMTATDMEIGIKAVSGQVEVIDAGSVLVNAHYFSDFIKLLPDLPIVLELNPDTAKLVIQYGRSSSSINTYRDYEYPDLPLSNMEPKLSLPQQVLKEALRKTSFAASQTHFRQVFTGCCSISPPTGNCTSSFRHPSTGLLAAPGKLGTRLYSFIPIRIGNE